MDLITGLTRTHRQHDSIWVTVERVTKSAHFLVVKTTYSAEDYAKLYIHEIVRLHGVPLSIISDGGPLVTSHFWKSFEKGLGAQMAPYEALYECRCRSPIGWFDVGEATIIVPDSGHEAMEKVSPMKGILRFGNKGKLNPRYVGPYRILKRIVNVAYTLELPAQLAAINPIFHISLLKKYVVDLASIVPLKSVIVKDSLTYEEVPVEILDHQVCRLRNKEVVSVNVLWRSQSVEGDTWEEEAVMKAKYPHLFPSDFVSA
ncbi:uncharacterized protein LOC125824261 [Solanum verrucosum]|uniref:uncharacterized protein LOC125824261 n=1 Tax=Solanum verrucosum TaxID=315347 RepID=UPI0020CFE99C|nr:uncharacterized protein LOC125824261 [Solanum verrucosum]